MQDDDEDTPPSTNVQTPSRNARQCKYYTDEDKALVFAWESVSLDAVIDPRKMVEKGVEFSEITRSDILALRSGGSSLVVCDAHGRLS
jgi:hypothetical protein